MASWIWSRHALRLRSRRHSSRNPGNGIQINATAKGIVVYLRTCLLTEFFKFRCHYLVYLRCMRPRICNYRCSHRQDEQKDDEWYFHEVGMIWPFYRQCSCMNHLKQEIYWLSPSLYVASTVFFQSILLRIVCLGIPLPHENFYVSQSYDCIFYRDW